MEDLHKAYSDLQETKAAILLKAKDLNGNHTLSADSFEEQRHIIAGQFSEANKIEDTILLKASDSEFEEIAKAKKGTPGYDEWLRNYRLARGAKKPEDSKGKTKKILDEKFKVPANSLNKEHWKKKFAELNKKGFAEMYTGGSKKSDDWLVVDTAKFNSFKEFWDKLEADSDLGHYVPDFGEPENYEEHYEDNKKSTRYLKLNDDGHFDFYGNGFKSLVALHTNVDKKMGSPKLAEDMSIPFYKLPPDQRDKRNKLIEEREAAMSPADKERRRLQAIENNRLWERNMAAKGVKKYMKKHPDVEVAPEILQANEEKSKNLAEKKAKNKELKASWEKEKEEMKAKGYRFNGVSDNYWNKETFDTKESKFYKDIIW